MMTDTQRTAQELAHAARLAARNARAAIQHDAPRFNSASVREAIDELDAAIDSLAALALQAEPVAEWVQSPVGDFPQLVWERGYEARIGDRLYATPPAPAQAEPTMSDAIAAGDGTLHGAIDYWQQRALKAEQSEDGRDAELLLALKDLRRAYVNLLESGRDRIVSLGGSCDPVDVMERNDPHLRRAAAAIAAKEQADPCPGCRPGIVCRTPKCGRLPKRSEQEVANGK